MLNFSVTKEQKELQQTIIEFASDNLNNRIVERDKAQVFDRELWNKAGELLLQGLAIPKMYGGKGLDAISTILALEALGYGCRDNGLSFGIGAHLLAVAVPLWLYGTTEQKEKYLPKLANGSWIGANAITEIQSGSDVYNMKTIGIKNRRGWNITGTKTYCSNAPVADVILAYVLTNPQKKALGGISAFILEQGHFTTSKPFDKMGMRTVLMSDVNIDAKNITDDNVVGREGGGLLMFTQSMIWERIGFSALHLGTMSRLLKEAIVFAKNRKVFGQSISKYQAISHTLATLKTDLEAARWLTYQAAWRLNTQKNLLLEAAMVKLKVSELYKKSTQQLLQIYGTYGYVNNHEIERMVRDATASTLYSGSSEIQKNIIAKCLKL